MASVTPFELRIDRWIDALCAGVRIFEDRALDPHLFERPVEEGPTDEIRVRKLLPRPTSA